MDGSPPTPRLCIAQFAPFWVRVSFVLGRTRSADVRDLDVRTVQTALVAATAGGLREWSHVSHAVLVELPSARAKVRRRRESCEQVFDSHSVQVCCQRSTSRNAYTAEPNLSGPTVSETLKFRLSGCVGPHWAWWEQIFSVEVAWVPCALHASFRRRKKLSYPQRTRQV